MRRSDWHRILEREYKACPCSFQNMDGVVSLLQIKKVTEPLIVNDGDGAVLIADKGYSWLQVAFREQLFWATVMYGEKGRFLQAYFDITARNIFDDMENPKFRDMYLDLVLLGDGRILVLDREELEEALQQNEITEAEFKKTVKAGEELYLFLQENGEEFLRFCNEQREKLLEEAV